MRAVHRGGPHAPPAGPSVGPRGRRADPSPSTDACGAPSAVRGATLRRASTATRRVWGGSSARAPMRMMLQQLFVDAQCLAVRVATEQNTFADDLSRGRQAAVLEAARARGWRVLALHVHDSLWDPLREAASMHVSA